MVSTPRGDLAPLTEEEARRFTEEQRANLRSWGLTVPDLPDPLRAVLSGRYAPVVSTSYSYLTGSQWPQWSNGYTVYSATGDAYYVTGSTTCK